DHDAVERHAQAAAYLAEQICIFRKAYPDRLVIVIGHSAGTHIVLLATQLLPDQSVDRIFLLAPSVACTYDLRKALRCSKTGIESFWSPEDGVLELAVDYIGTADRQKGVQAAGRVGFSKLPPGTPECELYGGLRQYKWYPDLAEIYGHQGGHYGWLTERS